MKRSLVFIFAAMALLATPVPAFAIGQIVLTDPEVRAELDNPTSWVSIVFDAGVDPAVAKMVVLNSAGRNVTVDSLVVDGRQVGTQLPGGLPEDTYTVMYRVNGPGGKPVGGSFQFAIGKGTWTAEASTTWSGPAQEPPILADPDPHPDGLPGAGSPSPTATTSPESSPASSNPPLTPTGGAAANIDWWPWLLGLAVVAGVAGVWLVRRGSRSGP